MKLSDFCKYNKITIQCHNNPDADALASAMALYAYFNEKGKDVSIVYCGRSVNKPNLKLLISQVGIPINNLSLPADKFDGLLLLVDCQYGEGNVSRLEADAIAVIDHHTEKDTMYDVYYQYIEPKIGSCSTIIWNMLREENFFSIKRPFIETALYYGLMTDTENFINVRHPLDFDMRDELHYDSDFINKLCNSNISLSELEIAGRALVQNLYNDRYRFSISRAVTADQNVIGMIIDIVKTVDIIDTCLIYSEAPDGYKLSVRSCTSEVRANELAEYLVEGIGSAGGHEDKAGGFCDKTLFDKKESGLDFERYIYLRMENYFENVEIIYSGEYAADITQFERFRRKKIVLGYIDPGDFLKADTKVRIRTLRGDVETDVDGSFYIMIGVLGEVYPISKSKFDELYTKIDEKYMQTFEYEPIMRSVADGKRWELIKYAKSCRVKDENIILAKVISNYTKVYNSKGEGRYQYARPGDYLACTEGNHDDIFVIRGDIFELSYDKI